MSRGVRIGLIITMALCIVLGIAIASVGTQLDEVRLQRDDLQVEVQDLQAESDTLRAERDTLKQRVEDQVKTLEHIKTQLAEERNQAQAPEATTKP